MCCFGAGEGTSPVNDNSTGSAANSAIFEAAEDMGLKMPERNTETSALSNLTASSTVPLDMTAHDLSITPNNISAGNTDNTSVLSTDETSLDSPVDVVKNAM